MSELPGMWSGPAMATGQAMRQPQPPRSTSEPAIGATGSDPGLSGALAAAAAAVSRAPTPVPARAPSISDSSNQQQAQFPSSASLAQMPRRSALGMFGWLLLGAILFGGVGALVYVALGERGERQPPQNNQQQQQQQVTPGSGSDVDTMQPDKAIGSDGSAAVVAPPNGSNTGSDTTQQGSNDDVPAPPDKTNPPKLPTKDNTKRPPKGGQVKKPVVAAIDEKDPKQLIKQGEQLEANGEWDQARGVWTKLEKIKGYQPNAVYRQAWAAFSGQNTEDAVRLAAKAASISPPGAQKTKAKFLYGDALYRQGAYDRAKDVYISLWKQSAGDDKATAQKKIAACNRALKKPESDGLQP
jgi:tetratricopeptide (TPR) repeat protein